MENWRLCKDIQKVEELTGIDYKKKPFAPKDLGLDPGNYGSFSEWCSRRQTDSGRHNRHVCLIAVDWDSAKRPCKYRLLPQTQWYIER
jgi:hypothetical protein